MIVKNKKERSKYEVALSRKRAWDVAVKSIAEAMPMTRGERKQQFTFQYEIPAKKMKQIVREVKAEAEAEEKRLSEEERAENGSLVLPSVEDKKRKKHSKKRKHKGGAHESGEEFSYSAPPRKKHKRSQSMIHAGPIDLSPSHMMLPDQLTDQSVAQFMVYCQKRRAGVKLENKDLDSDKIEELLKDTWATLPQDQQARYIPMGSDVKNLISDNLPEGMKRSMRVSKPTPKKQEVDIDNPLFKANKRRRVSL